MTATGHSRQASSPPGPSPAQDSWASPPTLSNLDDLRDAVVYAEDHDVLIVAAAGNSGDGPLALPVGKASSVRDRSVTLALSMMTPALLGAAVTMAVRRSRVRG